MKIELSKRNSGKFASGFLLAIPVIQLLSGCTAGGWNGNTMVGDGIKTIEKRDLPPFASIDLSGLYEVSVECQKHQSFQIEGDRNILPLISTTVVNGRLIVKESRPISPQLKTALVIAIPELKGVESSGASEVNIINDKINELSFDISGASKITASGECNTLKLASSGTSEVDSHRLKAGNVSIDSSGACNIDVAVDKQLDATVSGAGQVNYFGDPKVVNKHVSGVAQITKR